MNLQVFAIIVTYNGSIWIEKCLSSLKNSTVSLKVIVIDNNSSDDTVSIIKDKFSEVNLIELKKNIGFGAANNIGFKKALKVKADYVLLLNQDAYIDTYTVETLLSCSLKNREFGILSPFHFSYSNNKPEHYFQEWVMKRYTPKLEDDFRAGELQNLYPTSFVHAACWFMPISTIKEVGGFDPLFFHYGEDNDYVQRVRARRLKIGIVPEAHIAHYGSNEGLKNAEKDVRFIINHLTLVMKNPQASTGGVLALFFRRFATYQISGNRSMAKSYRTNLKRLYRILLSRREQRKELAYLNYSGNRPV